MLNYVVVMGEAPIADVNNSYPILSFSLERTVWRAFRQVSFFLGGGLETMERDHMGGDGCEKK